MYVLRVVWANPTCALFQCPQYVLSYHTPQGFVGVGPLFDVA
jgi:hypothetical protein